MKKIFIVFCTLLFQYSSIAQAPEMNFRNLHKYWEYKQQLHDKFVVIDWGGDGMGNYIPGEWRFERSGYSMPAASYWQYSNQEWRMRGKGLGFGADADIRGQLSEDNNLSEDKFGILEWGDGTVFLGHYIGVLATEFALLTQNNQPIQADRTLEELYLALQAYRRLDITANRVEEERAIRNGITCVSEGVQFDGFSGWFIREDAHSTIWQEFDDPEINGAVSDYSLRDRNIFHDYDHPMEREKNALDDVVLSQDQISHLLFGLALAKTYIPTDATVRGTNLRNIISNIADGLVFGNPDIKSVSGANVHGPVFPCEDRTFTIQDRGTEYWNRIGMLYAHSFITDTPVQIDATLGEKTAWQEMAKLFFEMAGGEDFNISIGFFNFLFDKLGELLIGDYDELDGNWNDNLTMYMALSAAGNPGQGVPLGSANFLPQHISTLWGIGTLGKYIYPLAMLNMHHNDLDGYRTLGTMYNRMTGLLNRAPCGGGCTPCDKSDENPDGAGFCNAEYNNQSGWCQAGQTEWQVSNRFINSPVDYHPTNKEFNRKLPGRRTNGLDYMLAYNLYHLTFINDMIPYFNTSLPEGDVEIKYVDNGNYPSQGIDLFTNFDEVNETVDVYQNKFPLHTDSEPLVVIAETIESNAQINAEVVLDCYDFELVNDVPTIFYCDNNNVVSDPKLIEISAGVTYKADEIILNDGFRTEEGAIFIAETTVGESVICLPDGTFGRVSTGDGVAIEEDLELTPSINPFIEPESAIKNILDSYYFKAYPNPFSHNLTIEYQLPKREDVQISLFNVAGQEVKKIVNAATQDAGKYQENLNSDGLTSGIYFVKMILDNKVITEKITLMQN